VIPDSDVDGEPYCYSDIDEVHKPSEPSSEPSSREGSVQRLRSALNAASVIPLDGVDIASELPPFGESDSDSGNGSESEQGSGRDSERDSERDPVRDSDPASHSEWSGFVTDDNYPTSEDEAIPNPPPTITVASIEDLQAAVNAWAKDKPFIRRRLSAWEIKASPSPEREPRRRRAARRCRTPTLDPTPESVAEPVIEVGPESEPEPEP